jgi:hypothetical protein
VWLLITVLVPGTAAAQADAIARVRDGRPLPAEPR